MIWEPRLRPWVWTPLLINLLVYALGLWAGMHFFTQVLDWLIPSWLEWLRPWLWPFFGLIFFAVTFFSFTLLANLIGSPFYGPLSGRVQENLGVSVNPVHVGKPWQALKETLAQELGRLQFLLFRGLPIGLMFLVPVLNLLATLLWILFGAWCLALEYFSYALENRAIPLEEQQKLLKKHQLTIVLYGLAVYLALAVPVLNILIPPAAVIGATLWLHEIRSPEEA